MESDTFRNIAFTESLREAEPWCPRIVKCLISKESSSKTIQIMQESGDLLTDELEVTDALKNYLLDAAKWGKFLAVIGLISCVLMVAGAFYAGYYVSHLPGYSVSSSMGQAITAFYIFFAVIWFYPCLFLYKFSVKLIQALKNHSQEYIESAFINLRLAFKFMGIVTIVILSLWLLSFVFLVAKNLTG